MVTQGEEELKAKKRVKPKKERMKRASVLLVLTIENRFLNSVLMAVPLNGKHFAISTMDGKTLMNPFFESNTRKKWKGCGGGESGRENGVWGERKWCIKLVRNRKRKINKK